jgi:signal transduction histidine kinase
LTKGLTCKVITQEVGLAVETDTPSSKYNSNSNNASEASVITGADRPAGPVLLSETGQHWLLVTLERLLAIETIDVKEALTETSDLVASALRADKVDVFLYEPEIDTLAAIGVSHTPTGKRQKELGLDRLLLANGGRSVLVFLTRQPFLTGHADQDPEQLIGIIEGLGIRSIISVPLYVHGTLRGVLEATSLAPEVYSEYDLRFLEAVAGWVGTILHRAELIEQIRSEEKKEARRTTAEELVTIIAHDLRNYFTPLLGNLGMLRRRAKEEKRTRDLENIGSIDNVLKHMNRMIDNLLDVARLEQGLFSIKKQPLELVGLVYECARAFDTATNPIIVQAPPELHLEADTSRIRQALENLLSNALKYSPEGAPVELIVNIEQDGTGNLARLAVVDKGPGIDPQILPRLFERFMTSARSSGLGMGLYLTKKIAQAHGGTVSAESAPGKGASFSLALPLTSNEGSAKV